MTYSIALDPEVNAILHMKLYRNVNNVPELRRLIIDGSLNCCIIKSSLIVDPFQVVVAANKACVAKQITTKTIYTELLFNLSISKNITQSLQKFGIDDKEKDILVIVIDRNDVNDCWGDLLEKIDGEEIDVLLVNKFGDENEIRKVYKLSDVEVKKISLLDSIVSRIATKDLL